MTRISHILILLSSIFTTQLYAQVNYSVTGVVTDSATGEPLIGAIVRVNEIRTTGAASDFEGNYRLQLPAGEFTMVTNVIGYRTSMKKIRISADCVVNFRMQDTSYLRNEVVIVAQRAEANISEPQMGIQKLDMNEISKLPVLFGERDIIRTVQLLPGIKSGGDGGGGLFVRGGASDQNLVLLDHAPIFSSSHLLGFFSTFDSDLLNDVTVYKGNQPSYYGGKLSSTLDIRMRDGDKDSFRMGGGIGLISTKLHGEGPIVPGKSSFLFGARRTYADIFLGLSKDSTINKNRLYFYDLHGKMSFTVGPRDQIFVSGYYGRDYFGVDKMFGISWGNLTGSVRWDHTLSDHVYVSTIAAISSYDYKVDIESAIEDVAIMSQIESYNLKHEYHYYPNNNHSMRFGMNSIYYGVIPGQLELGNNGSVQPGEIQDRSGIENAIYFSDQWKISEKLQLIYGVRGSSFSLTGHGDFKVYDEDGVILDTIQLTGSLGKSYFNIEPRFSAAYTLTAHNAVKFSYARNTQHIHLLSNSISSSPTDVWIMDSYNVKPETADQIAAGYYANFLNNKIEFSAEVYYKHLQNQIDYRDGTEVIGNDQLESELVFGKGRAYGLELFVKKKTGRFTGWVSYTLSRSERHMEAINNGNWYPVRQDKTHDLSVVLMYELNPRWSLAATWVYSTGNAVTFPGGKYYVDGNVHFMYTERNGYRMPAYHRLDIGANYQLKKTEKFESNLDFSVYNAYARENAYAITFRESPSDPGETEAVRIALFRMIPSVTYNFKF